MSPSYIISLNNIVQGVQALVLFSQLGCSEGMAIALNQIITNILCQYGSAVSCTNLGQVFETGKVSRGFIKDSVVPITGLHTAYRWMWAAKGTPEFRLRAARIAALVGISAVEAATGNPEANAAVGVLVARNIKEWKRILDSIPPCGGLEGNILASRDSVLMKKLNNQINLINFKKMEFQTHAVLKYHHNCQIIQSNIITEHTNKRFLSHQARKQLQIIRDIGPITIIPFIGWTFLATGIFTFTVVGSLYVFNQAEKNRFKKQAPVNKGDVIIDVQHENF